MLSCDSTDVPPDQQPLLHANHQDNAKPLRSFPICACYLYILKKKKLRPEGVDKSFV